MTDPIEPPGSRPPVRRCPICGKPASSEARPFCSPRCADVDLNRWLGGVYALPSSEDSETPDDETDPQR